MMTLVCLLITFLLTLIESLSTGTRIWLFLKEGRKEKSRTKRDTLLVRVKEAERDDVAVARGGCPCRGQHSPLQFWSSGAQWGSNNGNWLQQAAWLLHGESTGLPWCLASWLSAVTALLVFHLFLYLKWIKSHKTRESHVNAPDICNKMRGMDLLIYCCPGSLKSARGCPYLSGLFSGVFHLHILVSISIAIILWRSEHV